MEHYDWNEGWLFTPRFDPAPVRPECGLELNRCASPHTRAGAALQLLQRKTNTSACAATGGSFCTQRVGRPHCSAHLGAAAHDATVLCNGRRLFHHACGYTAFTVDLTSALHLGQKTWWLCAATAVRI